MRRREEEEKKKQEVVVTGDRYLECLVKFVDTHAWALLDLEDGGGSEGPSGSTPSRSPSGGGEGGGLTLKLNPVGLHYVQSRLDALRELEGLLSVDYLRAYVSDLGDHRALERLRRILRLLPSLKLVSLLPPPLRDPTPVSLLSFASLRVLELRGCDLTTSEPRGLLHLTHCLQKLICHNSTDALRHVFAGRVVDIKDSLIWRHLSFISCACNNLLLMDESLQLLPVVETLDLSRNKFTKIDNLKKCVKLQYLDLGFNHLRTVTSLREVSCPIVKLILRNNALTSLNGIENLKSLEAIDISYNVISKFSELELLSSLPYLKSLWLEGNPVSCARWYRARVFRFFMQPEKLELDGKGVCMREYWEMQAILARCHKKPTGYGFYFPANYGDKDSSSTKKKKKHFRLASIHEEPFLGPDAFDMGSTSCNSESSKKDGNVVSDNDADITDLIRRIELIKKEQSVLWLREYKEWMDKALTECDPANGSNKLRLDHTDCPFPGQTSRQDCIAVLKHSGSEEAMLEIQAADMSPNSDFNNYSTESSALCNHSSLAKLTGRQMNSDKYDSGNCSNDPSSNISNKRRGMDFDPLIATEDVVGSQSSCSPRSPPHYRGDILWICHNLEEDLSPISTETCSIASSDSDTSCSGDGSCVVTNYISRFDFVALTDDNGLNEEDSLKPETDNEPLASFTSELLGSDGIQPASSDNMAVFNNGNDDLDHISKESSKKSKIHKPRKRVVTL